MSNGVKKETEIEIEIENETSGTLGNALKTIVKM